MNEDNTLSYGEWRETGYGRASSPIVKNLLDDGVIDGFIDKPVGLINGETFTAYSSQLSVNSRENEYNDILERMVSFKKGSNLYLLSMDLKGGYYFWETVVVNSETFEKVFLETPRFTYVAPKMLVRYALVPNE